jgi:PAS domain-containing protein
MGPGHKEVRLTGSGDSPGLDKQHIVAIKNHWRWNVKTGHVQFSDSWCRSLGFEPRELTPSVETWKSLVHPDDMPKVWKVLEPHLDGKTKSYKCKNRLRMKSGLYRWNMDFGKVVVRGEDGEAIIMEGYDISIAS